MTESDLLNQYRHSANNCRQMLEAIDRKLARALDCLYKNDFDTCRELLEGLTSSLPEAMAIISHENDSQRDAAAKDKGC
ncbi:hypothetical protein [Aurantiacibacter gangjinensis]|uniref:Uncharacterized protein n=1 Tax=Aurantiacibacter gangjinensis TaxID=502682 RepID=A0A0G9MR33_9SPHN|nr:hypothetical protein [Aurantiacibacter gangjinensis]APE27781.1 hypothetical protein BMF35_a0952 [Aurantiacibacter gangjinensis]KLE31773.1 hypothetical protein AAW01_09735 [Aurantiacibacter gangjinensis]